MALITTIPRSRLKVNPIGCPRDPNRPAQEEHVGHRKVSTGLKNSSYSVPRRWSDIVILCLCENISEDMQANVRVYDLAFQKAKQKISVVSLQTKVSVNFFSAHK